MFVIFLGCENARWHAKVRRDSWFSCIGALTLLALSPIIWLYGLINFGVVIAAANLYKCVERGATGNNGTQRDGTEPNGEKRSLKPNQTPNQKRLVKQKEQIYPPLFPASNSLIKPTINLL